MKALISGAGSFALLVGPLATIGSFAFPTSAAQAGNPSEYYCEVDPGGGIYHKDGSNSWCEYPVDKPGYNPPGDQGSESQDTLSGHGNIDNKQQSGCDGNKGQCKQ